MAKTTKDRVSIGKFAILATYTYAKALLDGLSLDEAKQRGMVAAIMGAQARLGIRGGSHQESDFHPLKAAAETKKTTTITPELFDRQVRDQLGAFFEDVFVPGLTKLVQAGLSYEEVKKLLKIPATWGAKITGGQFREGVSQSSGED